MCLFSNCLILIVWDYFLSRNLKQCGCAAFFEVGIKLENGQLTITMDTDTSMETVSWAGLDCYFKCGSYVQSGTHTNFFVDYSSLTYTGIYDTVEKYESYVSSFGTGGVDAAESATPDIFRGFVSIR